jgi:cytolysin (calcineurin-like family phosphatase)
MFMAYEEFYLQGYNVVYVSKGHIASIFRVKE